MRDAVENQICHLKKEIWKEIIIFHKKKKDCIHEQKKISNETFGQMNDLETHISCVYDQKKDKIL